MSYRLTKIPPGVVALGGKTSGYAVDLGLWRPPNPPKPMTPILLHLDDLMKVVAAAGPGWLNPKQTRKLRDELEAARAVAEQLAAIAESLRVENETLRAAVSIVDTAPGERTQPVAV